MADLTVTADNMLVERTEGGSTHVAALKQSYDGGWSVSSDPEPLGDDMPGGTFPTREALIEAIRASGHTVEVATPSREGAGH